MAKHKITLLPGDGIGPEVTAAVVSIIECAGVDVEWEKRSIKILGTFSRQPLTRGRMWYLDFIPPTLESVRRCADELPEYGPLAALLPMTFSAAEARERAERIHHGQTQDHSPSR